MVRATTEDLRREKRRKGGFFLETKRSRVRPKTRWRDFINEQSFFSGETNSDPGDWKGRSQSAESAEFPFIYYGIPGKNPQRPSEGMLRRGQT